MAEALTRRLESSESLASIAELSSNAPLWMRNVVLAAQRRVSDIEMMCKAEVSKLRERADSLTSENDGLRMRLAEPKKKTTIRELEERIEILTSENALLVEESSALQIEIERSTAELRSREEECEAFKSRASTSERRRGELEKELGEVKDAAGAVEKRYVERAAELASANSQVAELKEGLASLHQQNEALRDEVDEKSRTIGELARRAEADGDELWQKVQEAASRSRELQEALGARSRELDSLADKYRRDSRELETVRADNAGMLRVMSGMEKQLATYAAREESVAAVARDSKEKAENALLARDKAAAREAQANRELEAERARRQADAERSLEAVDSSVKIERETWSAKLRERDAQLASAVERAATAEAKADRFKRETDQAQKAERLVRADFESLETRLMAEVVAPHEQKRFEAEARAAELERKSLLSQQGKQQQRQQRGGRTSSSVGGTPLDDDASLRQMQQRVEELEEELRIATADGASALAKLRDSAETLAAKDREATRLQKTLEDERSEAARSATLSARRFEGDRRRLEDALALARKNAQEADDAIAAQTERHKVQLAKLAADREQTNTLNSARLAEESDIVAKLSEYDKNLELKLAQALADLHTQKEYAAAQATAAKVAQRRAADLSTQLSKSLREQDQLLMSRSSRVPLKSSFNH